eukprot:gene18784-13574_t
MEWKEAEKRRDQAVSLRQKKKEELLREKRGRVDASPDPSADAKREALDAAGQRIPQLAAQLRSADPSLRRDAADTVTQLEGAWCVTNIISGTTAQCMAILRGALRTCGNV